MKAFEELLQPFLAFFGKAAEAMDNAPSYSELEREFFATLDEDTPGAPAYEDTLSASTSVEHNAPVVPDESGPDVRQAAYGERGEVEDLRRQVAEWERKDRERVRPERRLEEWKRANLPGDLNHLVNAVKRHLARLLRGAGGSPCRRTQRRSSRPHGHQGASRGSRSTGLPGSRAPRRQA
ncbi:MAG: hypothetical protein INR71_02975 [Terriglobus roseus]|nr:hypothetical protein [Terriglobus roseus]